MRNEQQLACLGFKFGKSGTHSARSMMIEELKVLLIAHDENATRAEYEDSIVNFNFLLKPTEKSRKLTFRYLVDLYGLDNHIPLFKVFREWWGLSESTQAVLALQLAVARDPLLRASTEVILHLEPREHLPRKCMEAFLAKDNPERFSATSLRSISQNLNGTWTQAGFLSGRAKKYRENPNVSYVNVAYALFLGYCHGFSGQRLFDSLWCRMLSQDKERLFELAHSASLRGLINFKQASEILEVTFPNIALPEV